MDNNFNNMNNLNGNGQNNSLNSNNINQVNNTMPVNLGTVNNSNSVGITTENLGSIDTLNDTVNTNQNNMMGTINLNPEGVVPAQESVQNEPSQGVEPLISTPLTNATNFENNNLNQNMNMGAGVTPNMGTFEPLNMNNNNILPNNMMGGINNVSNQNIDLMGVPTPPQMESESPKPKKNNKKVLILVLIIFLILIVGVGVYYVLNMSKNKVTQVTITPKQTSIELGSDLDATKASTLVNVTGYNVDSCTVSGNIDTKKAGTYSYTVTCGNKTTSEQKIEVKDTTSPIVALKEVIVTPNTDVSADDFILDIEDASPCTSSFVGDVDTSEEGTFEVEIIVSDAYDNQTETLKGTLIVTNDAPESYLYCEPESDDDAKIVSYRFGITNDSRLYSGEEITTFAYDSEEAYNAAVNEIEETKTLNGLTGNISYDKTNYKIKITTKKSSDDLAKDFNLSEFPTTDSEIEALFPNGCEIGVD